MLLEMGNICNTRKGSPIKPPRDITSLVQEISTSQSHQKEQHNVNGKGGVSIVASESQPSGGARLAKQQLLSGSVLEEPCMQKFVLPNGGQCDQLIRPNSPASSWESQFRRFLRSRNQGDVENCLNFVLDCERIIYMTSQETEHFNNNKRIEELRGERVAILREMGSKYFTPESDSCLPLTNQVLLSEIGETLTNLNHDEVEDAVAILKQARFDDNVWRNGLDLSYRQFLANYPSLTVKAVIMSIL